MAFGKEEYIDGQIRAAMNSTGTHSDPEVVLAARMRGIMLEHVPLGGKKPKQDIGPTALSRAHDKVDGVFAKVPIWVYLLLAVVGGIALAFPLSDFGRNSQLILPGFGLGAVAGALIIPILNFIVRSMVTLFVLAICFAIVIVIVASMNGGTLG